MAGLAVGVLVAGAGEGLGVNGAARVRRDGLACRVAADRTGRLASAPAQEWTTAVIAAVSTSATRAAASAYIRLPLRVRCRPMCPFAVSSGDGPQLAPVGEIHAVRSETTQSVHMQAAERALLPACRSWDAGRAPHHRGVHSSGGRLGQRRHLFRPRRAVHPIQRGTSTARPAARGHQRRLRPGRQADPPHVSGKSSTGRPAMRRQAKGISDRRPAGRSFPRRYSFRTDRCMSARISRPRSARNTSYSPACISFRISEPSSTTGFRSWISASEVISTNVM